MARSHMLSFFFPADQYMCSLVIPLFQVTIRRDSMAEVVPLHDPETTGNEGSCPILQSRRCIERLRRLGLWLSTDRLSSRASASHICISVGREANSLSLVKNPTTVHNELRLRSGRLDQVFIDGSVIMSDLVRDTLSSRELSVVDVDGGRHSAAVRIRPYVGFNYLSHTVPHGALRPGGGHQSLRPFTPRHACVLRL